MEPINTINKTLFGAALAVLALAMAIPQGTALAGGMNIHTADLCLVDDITLSELPEFDSEAIGTVAAVTDKRNKISPKPWTAWAVSLEGMELEEDYEVYDDGPAEWDGTAPEPCLGDFVYGLTTMDGSAFANLGSDVNPEVGHFVRICRCAVSPSDSAVCSDEFVGGVIIPILEGVLVKGGKERNKPNRC